MAQKELATSYVYQPIGRVPWTAHGSLIRAYPRYPRSFCLIRVISRDSWFLALVAAGGRAKPSQLRKSGSR